VNKDPKRILLKVSGEVLKGTKSSGVCNETCRRLALAFKKLHETGLEIGLVIGGGNFVRGQELSSSGMSRTPADQMGMLATVMNGIALQHHLTAAGLESHVMSGLDCPGVVDSYRWQKAIDLLNQKKVVLFVGGTGSPYFTTDTAAALRASEIEADLLLKATKVDGIYDKDPARFRDAKKIKFASFQEALEKDLAVMDLTAFTLCRENEIPILVFNMDLLIVKQSPLETLIESGSLIS
jgi:uridylate kinase